MRALLPTEITIGSMENISHDDKIMTKLMPVEYNTAWEIYSNDNALDVRKSNEPAPTEDTIEIHNKNSRTSSAVVAKNGKPLFKCDVRPRFKVNFAIHPSFMLLSATLRSEIRSLMLQRFRESQLRSIMRVSSTLRSFLVKMRVPVPYQ